MKMIEAYNVRTHMTTKSYEMWKGGSVNTNMWLKTTWNAMDKIIYQLEICCTCAYCYKQ